MFYSKRPTFGPSRFLGSKLYYFERGLSHVYSAVMYIAIAHKIPEIWSNEWRRENMSIFLHFWVITF